MMSKQNGLLRIARGIATNFLRPLRILLTSVEDYFIQRRFKYNFDNMATSQNLAELESGDFRDAYHRAILAADRDLHIPLRIHQAIWCAEYAMKIPGDFVELGTGRGFTFSAIMAWLSKRYCEINKNTYLFDTFKPVKPDPLTGKQVINGSYQIATAYSDDVEAVRGNFSEWSNVEIIQGELPGSASNYLANGPSIAFLHVDLNHKIAEISTLEAMWPRLSPGAVILLDDYANNGRDEQWHAHQRFFQERNLYILTLASGQGLVVVANPSQ